METTLNGFYALSLGNNNRQISQIKAIHSLYIFSVIIIAEWLVKIKFQNQSSAELDITVYGWTGQLEGV